MYYAIVALLMFALPALAIGVESRAGVALDAALVLKWYVFWAVGWRLGLAGARQIAQPAYTARVILGHQGDESLLVVRELGFANLAMGVAALASFWMPAWRPPVALAAGIFYGLAGGGHVLQKHRNRLETVAMGSDLFAAAVLLGGVAMVVWR